MAESESDLSQVSGDGCIFCLIANGQDKEAEVMKKVSSHKTGLKSEVSLVRHSYTSNRRYCTPRNVTGNM